MYDSEVSGYDIVDATPYGQDVLKQLAEACERHGLKLFFYYSQLDWHHPDYYPRGRTGAHTGRPDDGEWQDYLAYMDAQLAELLTRYGDIGGIWFDGWWDKPDADWRLGETYALIHRLQPDAMIGSNHHREPFPGEDFQMFEKGLPGKDPFSEGGHVSELPLETCETINNSWGYNAGDDAHKSAEEIIRLLVKAAGNDANLLLNVGPKPDGTIQETHRERLLAVGEWLKGHGEAIYGTRGGPIAPQSWGVTTQDAGHVYVHVLSGDPVVALPPLDGEITGARTLAGEPVAYQATGVGVILRVPEQLREETDAVIVLDRPR
jgi:alpha-L-fucosidase